MTAHQFELPARAAPYPGALLPWPEPVQRAYPASGPQSHDRDFVAMRTAYRASGGIARGDDLAGWLEHRQRGDYLTLARLIVAGDIFSFKWNETFWVPMFQFDGLDFSVTPASRQVLAELVTAFDGWSTGVWFAGANRWLGGQRPVDVLFADLPAVLAAARADCAASAG